VRSERKNRFGNPEILENFGWNLVIATGGLEQEETVGVRRVLQRVAIGEGWKEMNQIFDAFSSDHGFVCRLVTGSPEFYANPRSINLSVSLQLRNGSEKGLRVAFDGVQQTHMHKAKRPAGDGSAGEQIPKIFFVVTI